MLTKFMVLLVAGTSLAGCCVSGTGCSTPTAGAPVAWDGLGEAPTANGEQGSENRPKRRTATQNREIILGPLNETSSAPEARSRQERPEDQWAKLPAEDRDADAKLTRQLRICQGC